METISYTLPPEQDGATVRHILKAALHVSSHAISRLTRTENGIRVNGIHARTVDILHTGDVLEVETSDHRPPRVRPTPGQERLHPRPAPVRAPHGEVLPGVPGGVHRLSGSEIRHHRRPHRPGPEFCGGPVRPA